MMAPLVGFSSMRIIFMVVLFPHPDSPTRPTVSPAPTVYETPSTAFTRPMVFWKIRPCMTGKCFFRSRISSSLSLIAPPTTSNVYSGSRPPGIQEGPHDGSGPQPWDNADGRDSQSEGARGQGAAPQYSRAARCDRSARAPRGARLRYRDAPGG